MNKNLKYFIIFLLSAVLISLVYHYFGDFWNFANSEPFLKKYFAYPIENFLYSFESDFVIGTLVIFGLILTIIFIFLAIYEISKFLKFVQKR